MSVTGYTALHESKGWEGVEIREIPHMIIPKSHPGIAFCERTGWALLWRAHARTTTEVHSLAD